MVSNNTAWIITVSKFGQKLIFKIEIDFMTIITYVDTCISEQKYKSYTSMHPKVVSQTYLVLWLFAELILYLLVYKFSINISIWQ